MFEKEIMFDPMNLTYTKQNLKPVYQANKNALIVIIGQAPGEKAQQSGIPFNDISGDRLRSWMGIDKETFYSEKIAILPMDFYFPGKGKTGDLPPRKGFIGAYAIKYYLGVQAVTEAVKHYSVYLPNYFVLIHPSPLNQRWISKNPWFLELLPVLKLTVNNILSE
jgi:uracil-DNA glycosylase